MSWGRRRIPVIVQLTTSECGAACLAMVLALHGRRVRLDEIAGHLGAGRDGVSGKSLLAAASSYGLDGRGVRMEPADLRLVDRGAILHWEFNHFVVFERLRARSVDIIDPASGRVNIPLAQFGRSFTGVALLLHPANGFSGGGSAVDLGPLSRYARMILAQWRLIARILVLSLMLQAFGAGIPLMTGALIDRVIPHQDWPLLQVLAWGLGMVTVFQFLASLVRGHLLAHLRTHLDARITLSFLHHLMSLPYKFFQHRPPGDLLMRISSNAAVRDVLTNAAISTVLDGLFASGYLVALLYFAPRLAALTFALGLVDLVALALVWRAKQRLVARSLSVQARTQSYQMELLNGIESLKSMGAEHRAAERWANLLTESLNVSLRQSGLDATLGAAMGAVKMVSGFSILGYGSWQVMNGGMSLGTMMAMTALASGFMAPFSSLFGVLGSLPMLKAMLARVADVLDEPPEQNALTAQPAPRLRGRIELRAVSFRYSPQAADVVTDVSATIEPGQSVAIVGATGSGKSTIASLMVGLYRPSAGQVRYDQHDLADLDLAGVRSQIGVVTQRTFLFAGSIRSNVALADPDASLEAITEACRLACVDEEIAAMPLGYETLLAAGGGSISGGQRQRLALARALIGKPAVLLLDEATSSLDAVTERRVHQHLRARACTRIVISHRLSTIIDADLILVLDQGRIVDRGNHHELVRRSAIYSQVVAAQELGMPADGGLDRSASLGWPPPGLQLNASVAR
jgi:ATP-binding cassette subfamily B protein